MAKKSEEFKLRVHATGDFGKKHQESGQRSSATEDYSAGVRDLDEDELRLHAKGVKTSRRGPAELPRREREAGD